MRLAVRRIGSSLIYGCLKMCFRGSRSRCRNSYAPCHVVAIEILRAIAQRVSEESGEGAARSNQPPWGNLQERKEDGWKRSGAARTYGVGSTASPTSRYGGWTTGVRSMGDSHGRPSTPARSHEAAAASPWRAQSRLVLVPLCCASGHSLFRWPFCPH